MNNLNKLELQNLRHLIGSHTNLVTKLQYYAEKCDDDEAVQMFNKAANDVDNTKNKLIGFLE
jgi:hypothetical protein